MAKSTVIVKVAVDIAHPEGMNWKNIHQLAKELVDSHLEFEFRGQGEKGDIVSHKVQSVADAGPNQTTRWR